MKRVVHSLKAAQAAFGVMSQACPWDKPYMLSLKRFRPPKTNEQCALLHVLWREIAIHVGRGEDEIKDIFKAEYGPEEVKKTPDGNRVRILKSVSDYSFDECSKMIERAYQKGAEWGVEFAEVA